MIVISLCRRRWLNSVSDVFCLRHLIKAEIDGWPTLMADSDRYCRPSFLTADMTGIQDGPTADILLLLLLLLPFYGPLSRTTRVSHYQKKHSPTHLSRSSSNLYELLPSATIQLQFTRLTIFLHNLSPTPLWSTSCSEALHLIFHTFLHPISVFFSQHMPIPTIAACFAVVLRLYHLFLVSLNLSLSLSLNSLLGTLSFYLMSHIHLTILISALWSATSFSSLTGQVSLPCSILLRTQLLYSLPLLINDISLLVSNGTNCLNLFNPIWILAFTTASASPSTLNMSPR